MEHNKNSIEPEIKKKIIALISSLYPTAKIYLFGSRARGDHSAYSDIDIALDVGHKLERVLIGEVRNILNASLMPYTCDVVDINSVSEAMRTMIMKEKIIWKS